MRVVPINLKTLKNCGGFTYLAALMVVMIMGIMLGVVGESMYMVNKREREEELLFRGGQYQDAIERWNKRTNAHVPTPLLELDHLLKDPRSLANVRYLRRLYKDPLTEEKWVEIKDPVKGIVGVRSSSNQEPAKQANFPEKWKNFEGKTSYSEWQFVFGPVAPQGTIKGLKTTSPTSGTGPFGSR